MSLCVRLALSRFPVVYSLQWRAVQSSWSAFRLPPFRNWLSSSWHCRTPSAADHHTGSAFSVAHGLPRLMCLHLGSALQAKSAATHVALVRGMLLQEMRQQQFSESESARICSVLWSREGQAKSIAARLLEWRASSMSIPRLCRPDDVILSALSS